LARLRASRVRPRFTGVCIPEQVTIGEMTASCVWLLALVANASSVSVLVTGDVVLRNEDVVAALQPLPAQLLAAQVVRVGSNPATDAARLKLERAQRAMATAERLTFELELQKAVDAYREALSLLDAGAEAIEDFSVIAQCQLRLGAVLLELNRVAQAKEAFTAAATLQTKVEADPARFNPNTVAQFARAQREALQAPSGSITLTGQPEGAQVRIDGRNVGTLPLSLRGLPPGHHWVKVTDEGHFTFVTQFVLEPARPAKLEVYLRETATPLEPLVRACTAPLTRGGAEIAAAQVRATGLNEAFVVTSRTLCQFFREPHLARALTFAMNDTAALAAARIALSESRFMGSPVAVLKSAPAPNLENAAAVKRLHPALAVLPFGGAQFLQHRTLVGGLFLGAELLLLATNIATAVVVLQDRDPQGGYFTPERSAALRVVNIAAFSALLVTVIGGGIDGLLHR
jgi:PEGA domain